MIASVPCMAFGSPPLTGASRKSTPLASQAAATFCETMGLIELMSMTSEPGAAPSSTPSGPSTTCSTSGPSGSMVMMMLLREATSLGDAPFSAPAWTSSSTGWGTTSCTTSLKPALSKFDMGLPMIPSPMKPIF